MKTFGIAAVAALSTLALGAAAVGDGKSDKKHDHADHQEAKAELGKPAPDFELKSLDGKTVKLSDYKGKTVVLEWFNPECPFVVYAHTEGTLKDAAAQATKDDGVVWLAINSGAPGMQGAGAEKNKKWCEEWKMSHPVLLDEEGVAGRAYGAKHTPQMYVVDAKGILVYRGGIDNAPMGRTEEGAEVVNYVSAALADIKAGREVAKSETKAYGCSVKYANKKEKSKEKVKE